MRLSLALAGLSALSLANAAYFSQGWKPGQPLPTHGIQAGQKPNSVPIADFMKPKMAAEPAPRKSIFELAAYLQEMAQDALTSPLRSGPVADLITKTTGVNISEAMEKAKLAQSQSKFDPRIQQITDDTWEEIIEYEQLTPEEEDNRAWLILITLPERNAVAQFAEDQFVKAFNETMDNGNDLPDIKWGTIDYYNVTVLTTQWMVWKAPLILIASHRGKDLRFFHPTQIKLRELHDIMKEELWKSVPPWRSSWGPGGDNAWLLRKIGKGLAVYNDTAGKLPKWVIMMGTGVIGSFVIQFLHSSGKKKDKNAPVLKKDADVKPAAPATPSAASTPKKLTGESRKEASKRNRAAKRMAD
ncbi:hypothetical protein CALCODRAFT_489484 [Calocera cornea HHB12733]|uniref:Uncharacterized protein n=1 Tax=Calocera cornea HHB12733 TaxID=1353952 RepID=A0A165KC35_9BASI|nr:hypothetical protein CALCODRAFT_489484 [Calocera cornea HHB12733]